MSLFACPDCATAAERLWCAYRRDCLGCRARMLSRGPAFYEAGHARKQTREYRDALKAAGVTHKQVKAAHQADAMNKVKA